MPLTISHITNEEALCTECLNGNRLAQKQLYEQYVDHMMLTCLRYIPQSEDAQEVMLDGFMNGYKNLDRFEYRGDGSLRAWLKKIMVNQCLMFLRKSNPIQSTTDEIDHNEAVIDTDAIARLSIKELMQLIHRLPDGYRTVFNLHTFEAMTHKEIGTLLGISENTSKSQLHKAKTLLQQNILNNTKTSR